MLWLGWVIAARAAPVSDWLDAVVLLTLGNGTCSGVHVGGGRIATAYHCTAAGGRLRATARNGTWGFGRVVAVDAADDLAVVQVDALDALPSLAVAGACPPIGAPVWALGHPLGGDGARGLLVGTLLWSASEGSVAAVGARALQVTPALNHGNSGGPLVDAEGQVVGIASRRLAGDSLGFAVRSELLVALLDGPPSRLGPVGGTVAVELVGGTLDGSGGVPSVGGRAELSFRDHLLVEASAYAPLEQRWNAARFGSATAELGDLLGGARLRLGRGLYTTQVDLLGGLVGLERWSRPDGDPFDVTGHGLAAPIVSGQLTCGGFGLEIGWLPTLGMSRTLIVVRWPGVFNVF